MPSDTDNKKIPSEVDKAIKAGNKFVEELQEQFVADRQAEKP